MKRFNPLLAVLICGYVSAFAYFRTAHDQERNRTKQAISGLLRNESLAGNTYALSKSVLDLERLGLISCSRIYENGKDGTIFYNSNANEACVRNRALRVLLEDEVLLKAINGTTYLVQLQFPTQWQIIFTELLTYLLLSAWIIIYIRHTETQRVKNLAAEALVQHSLRISHDIRAPLAVLTASIARVTFPDINDREIFSRALHRLTLTANGLLKNFKNENSETSESFDVRIKDLLEEVIRENSWLLTTNKSTKSIKWNNSLEIYSLCLELKGRTQLLRAVQNLIQNAIEASPEGGTVKILSFEENANAIIEIIDEGSGVPPEILNLLGKEVVSGKSGGTGLGFISAKSFIESTGGDLFVQSSSQGTRVRITLKNKCLDLELIALIDDDALIRDLWMRAAKRKNIRLQLFKSIHDFTAAKVENECAIFLDIERGDGVPAPEVVAQLRGLGYKKVWISTAHPNFDANGISGIQGVVGKEPPWL